MAHGFLYLVAILDVASRKVLSFRVSNTMTPDFCVDALTEAIARYGPPEIVNTDQGSQFTSKAWTDVLDAAGVRISMDGKGRWIDNVFIERLWRLCALGRYVADGTRRSRFAVNARRMRAHNDGARSVRRKGFGSLKDDYRKRRAASPRGQRRMRRRPKVLQRTQPVEQWRVATPCGRTGVAPTGACDLTQPDGFGFHTNGNLGIPVRC
jgi:hypothetical protein